MADIVLLVITDHGVAQSFERAFRALGVDAVIADEAESALVALEFEKPIAVVLENDLPDRSGVQFAAEIRKRAEGVAVPIILLAGAMMSAEELAPRVAEAQVVTACLDGTVDRGALANALVALLREDAGPMQRLVDGIPEGSVTEIEDALPESSATVDEEIQHLPIDDRTPPPDVPRAAPVAKDAAPVKAKPAPVPKRRPAAEARTGSLAVIPFGRLLAELHDDFATGQLDLTREKVKKSIWLRDGAPVYAKSNAMGETLGAVLVKMGRITEAQRNTSMDAAQKTKRKHGDVLVEMGFIKPKDVGTALQAQARAKVINCFAWDDGTYSFKPSDELPGDLPELKMTFGALITAGVKQRYDLPRLRRAIDPHIGETPRFQEKSSLLLDEMKVDDDERTVLENLRGKRSTAEVLAMSDMDEAQLHRILVSAWFAGVVRFANEGPSTPIVVGKEVSAPKKPIVEIEADDEGEKTHRDEPTPEPTRAPTADPAVVARIEAALARMETQNHYERLGVPTDATDAAIKSAYLKLAKEFHPDKLISEGGSALKEKADKLFAMFSEANHTLMDSGKRRKYDDEVLHGKSDDASDEANAILNAEHQFLKGERFLKAGNAAKAFEAFKTAIDLYPKESEYQAFYGWTMFKLNHPATPSKADEGEKIVRDALKSNSRNDKAHLFLGQIANLKGAGDDARKHFEKALEIQPDNIEAQRELRVIEMRESKKGIGGLFRGKK